MILASAFLMVATVASPIEFRGVVEGYYGRPWGTEGRISLMEFMGPRGLNTFIYGPKDDPYHHAKWREPYPAAELADFAKLLTVAKKQGIRLYWAIHLGGGFRKGHDEDYAALFRKLGWMYEAGFRAFAVFFDDFGGADAEFHAEICNRVQGDFLGKKGDCAPLVMCPNVYWGSGHPYQKTLGAKLDPAVHVMWTGARICSDIKAADVAKITADLKRPPFVWWNWPVNDYCRRKVLLGRTYGADDCAYAGFVINPMENCEANKIALHGFADWARNPAGFDSKKSWEASFAKIYPDPGIAAALRVFAEHNSDQAENGHGYRREESVSVASLCQTARREYAASGRLTPATAKGLAACFTQLSGAASTLLKKLDLTQGLGWELEGWLRVEKAQMEQGLLALELLKGAKRETLDKIAAARRRSDEAAEAHVAKFREATFPNDKGHVKRPEASTKELAPLVEMLLEGELGKLYRARTGKPYDAAAGFAAFSTAKALPHPVAARDGKYAGLTRVLEPRAIAPGETFGLTVPAQWQTDYFHAKLGSVEATQGGIIELSKDGQTWERLATHNHGEEMEARLDPAAGWRHARYRNVSDTSVSIKLNLFKFDVRGIASPIDGLLGCLSDYSRT